MQFPFICNKYSDGIMNNPFDYIPDIECREAFLRLVARIDTLKRSEKPEDVNFCRELEAGKMLGVLVASDADGGRHALFAFSGQLGDGGFHYPGFVEPVFDYLSPDGYFKKKEADISRQNKEIALLEQALCVMDSEYGNARNKEEAVVAEFKERCRLSKMERDARRAAGVADETELAAMTRQSQFEKAELRRIRQRSAARLEPLVARLGGARTRIEMLKERRRADSEALQHWLFSNFKVLDARGESCSLSEIFAETVFKVPPSGAGECCAPKLLQAAYKRGWRPEAIAEYWYGRPKGGELRIHGSHYPACRGKCLPVLGWMLRGLAVDPPLEDNCRSVVTSDPKIIYENRWFCVVDKPSGMLSVPGKGAALSVQQWLASRYGPGSDVRMAHRLDRDTSGLLVATFGPLPFKTMQSLFATRRVEKRYVAVLEGDYESRGIPGKGSIGLPLSADWLDRPRQRVDPAAGKEALTDYEFTGVSDGRSRVIFIPRTGRTHQLRVHAASEAGLGMPIAGDPLYGANAGAGSGRLLLHAWKLEFTFPVDGRRYCFESPVPF